MGRFSSLEFGEAPAGSAVPPASGRGEPIKDAQYFLDRADLAFFRQEYDAALQEYSRAAGIDAGSAAAWQGQVFTLIALEEFHEAQMWLAKAVEIVGETPELLALRALLASRTGDFSRACGYADAALEAGGASPLPFLVRGELFCYSRGNAALCFNQAFAMPGADWRHRLLAVDFCLYTRRAAAVMLALSCLQPALECHPTRPELYLRLAAIHICLNQRRPALAALDQAAGLDHTLAKIFALRREAARCSFWKRIFNR